MNTANSLHGIIRGKAIELIEDSGLPEGALVTVVLNPSDPASIGLDRSAAGAWKAFPEMDAIMASIELERAHDARGDQ